MSDRVFFDTNVWVYAAMGSESSPERFARARELLETCAFAVSTQVVGEFVNVSQKKKAHNRALTPLETTKWANDMLAFPLVEVDRAIVESAIFFQRRYGTSYWDSQMIACAERSGAAVLFSEDLSHQQKYGALRCVNPFADH
jgi:predicted nucleic acid-binding protein